jgi:hypothetical protein
MYSRVTGEYEPEEVVPCKEKAKHELEFLCNDPTHGPELGCKDSVVFFCELHFRQALDLLKAEGVPSSILRYREVDDSGKIKFND